MIGCFPQMYKNSPKAYLLLIFFGIYQEVRIKKKMTRNHWSNHMLSLNPFPRKLPFKLTSAVNRGRSIRKRIWFTTSGSCILQSTKLHTLLKNQTSMHKWRRLCRGRCDITETSEKTSPENSETKFMVSMIVSLGRKNNGRSVHAWECHGFNPCLPHKTIHFVFFRLFRSELWAMSTKRITRVNETTNTWQLML